MVEYAPALISLFGVILTLLLEIIRRMLRRRLNSVEGKIDSLEQRLQDQKKENQNESHIIVNWLVNMTEAMKRNEMDVDRPDEVEKSITMNYNDRDGSQRGD